MTTPPPTLDYQALWDSCEGDSTDERLDVLWDLLNEAWMDLYIASVATQGLYEFVTIGSFVYAQDTRRYPDGEPFDFKSMIDDRVIFVAGTSNYIRGARDPFGMRGPLCQYEFGETPADCQYDRGHFIAHSLGGHPEIGLFAQRRDINRGRGEGRGYVAMERYGRKHPGTFIFSRPIYGDNTNHPYWIEYGVLKEDGEFWVHVFPNRVSFTSYTGPELMPPWHLEWLHEEKEWWARRVARHQERLDREMREKGRVDTP